jgi:hypothetical protein
MPRPGPGAIAPPAKPRVTVRRPRRSPAQPSASYSRGRAITIDRNRVLGLVSWAAVIWIAREFLWYEQYKLTGNVGSIDWVFQPLASRFGFPAHGKPIRLFVALLEMVAAVLVLVPRSRVAGASLALGVMGGAIFFQTIGPIGIYPYGDGGGLFKETCFTWAMAALILAIDHTEVLRLARRARLTLRPSAA